MKKIISLVLLLSLMPLSAYADFIMDIDSYHPDVKPVAQVSANGTNYGNHVFDSTDNAVGLNGVYAGWTHKIDRYDLNASVGRSNFDYRTPLSATAQQDINTNNAIVAANQAVIAAEEAAPVPNQANIDAAGVAIAAANTATSNIRKAHVGDANATNIVLGATTNFASFSGLDVYGGGRVYVPVSTSGIYEMDITPLLEIGVKKNQFKAGVLAGDDGFFLNAGLSF